MSTESTCSFNSTDCKGVIRQITNNTKIPITNKEIILVGMKLCFDFNKNTHFLLNYKKLPLVKLLNNIPI